MNPRKMTTNMYFQRPQGSGRKSSLSGAIAQTPEGAAINALRVHPTVHPANDEAGQLGPWDIRSHNEVLSQLGVDTEAQPNQAIAN